MNKSINIIANDMKTRADIRLHNGGYTEISVSAIDLLLVLNQLTLESCYNDAIAASNELGYVGMSAEQVIRCQGKEIAELKSKVESQRQRAEDVEQICKNEYQNRKKMEAEIAALKGSVGAAKDWEIDHSAGVPILVYKKCSVIESEAAYGLLELIKKSGHSQKPVVLPTPYYGDRNCLDKREVIAAIEASGGTVNDDGYSSPENDSGQKSIGVVLNLLQNQQEALTVDVIRDANRYRFLRDEDAWGEDSDSWDPDTRTGLISSENLMGGLSPDHFDAAIDARMAASDIPFFNPVKATDLGDQA